jgi:hypothetical protein
MTNAQQRSPIFCLDKVKKHLYNTIWGIKPLLILLLHEYNNYCYICQSSNAVPCICFCSSLVLLAQVLYPSAPHSDVPLSLGLYVDDFVYFPEDPKVEVLFERLLQERVKVDFMGLVEWFLGIHFSWHFTSSRVDVHLNQTGFAASLVELFCWDSWDPTPTATPYQSGVPINSIAPSPGADDYPSQLQRTKAYQSLIGSIGWLAMATRPDLAPVHSFLSSYNSKPSSGHMKAALHALHYIHSTHDFGIHLHRRLRILFTLLSTSRTRLTLKLILMQSRLLPHINLLSHPTVMHVGSLKPVWLSVMVHCFHYLNAAA